MHARAGVGLCPEAGNVAGTVWSIMKFNIRAFQVCNICCIYNDRATGLSTIRQFLVMPMIAVCCYSHRPQPCTPMVPVRSTGSNHTGCLEFCMLTQSDVFLVHASCLAYCAPAALVCPTIAVGSLDQL
jgi:hypothetical protein